jgi:hypothetical protein
MTGNRVTIVSNLLEALDVLDKEPVELLLVGLYKDMEKELANTRIINQVSKDTTIMYHYQLSNMPPTEIARLVVSLHALTTRSKRPIDPPIPSISLPSMVLVCEQ